MFTIYSEDKSYFIRTMSIYDRWGEQLFYGTDLKAGQGWEWHIQRIKLYLEYMYMSLMLKMKGG
ncbi:MAG: hypothetical protein IPL98_04710 [Saprospiraceae bacterium]|nr:hypothetical protein [Saprospiraceae bacterium]